LRLKEMCHCYLVVNKKLAIMIFFSQLKNERLCSLRSLFLQATVTETISCIQQQCLMHIVVL
jgi:hypothetical protein